jgi:hypothetical protein
MPVPLGFTLGRFGENLRWNKDQFALRMIRVARQLLVVRSVWLSSDQKWADHEELLNQSIISTSGCGSWKSCISPIEPCISHRFESDWCRSGRILPFTLKRLIQESFPHEREIDRTESEKGRCNASSCGESARISSIRCCEFASAYSTILSGIFLVAEAPKAASRCSRDSGGRPRNRCWPE